MSKFNGPRVNQAIRVPSVRVIEDGKMVGVMPTADALKLARDKGVDLIEIDPKGTPPTCRLMELGKFKYEQKKKDQQARQNQKQPDTKELKVRPRTEDHDLGIKIKKAREFIEDGDKVRFVVMFHGREMAYKDQGVVVLNKVVDALKDIAQLDSPIKNEGNNTFMLLAPKKA